MRVAMLFPGQGSQHVGMGADLVTAYPEARRTFETGDAVLGMPLSALCFEGPLERLTETRHAQPALLVHAVAACRVLASFGVEPAIVAGHSVGEYAALVAAGVLEFETALRLVQQRGALMFAAGLEVPGTMAAIVGLDAAAVESACAPARGLGVCDLANLNTDDQIVISGAVPAVEDAMARCTAAGARLAKQLNVSGAFHSALMREPGARLASALGEAEFAAARVPVVTNVGAVAETRGSELRELLGRQIYSPVRWVESMRGLRAAFGGLLLEVGPGNVLRGLLRRIDRAAEAAGAGDVAGLEACRESAGRVPRTGPSLGPRGDA